MPTYNFSKNYTEKKESIIPKSTTNEVGELVATIDSIDVVPMGENGYKRIFITYNVEDEQVVTEFNPPYPNSLKYELRNKEGKLNMNVNEKWDSPTSLFYEDLWKSSEPFLMAQRDKDGKTAMLRGKEDLYGYEDLNCNKNSADKYNKYIQKYGILYAFEKLMAHISPYTLNKDSNMNVSDWTLFSSNYKHPANLLVTVTDKNIKDFGYYKTTQWVTNNEGKNEKVVLPLDTVAKETLNSKAGNPYTVFSPADKNPAYIETVKTKVLDFTKKYKLVNGEYVAVSGDEKGYPAAFYSYFEMLGKFIESLKEKGAKSLENKFKIFVYGGVNKFTAKDGKEITTPLQLIDYTNTNRRWFFPYSDKLNNVYPKLFVQLVKYDGELMEYNNTSKLNEGQKEHFKLVGESENNGATNSVSKSEDTDVLTMDDDDDLPF